MTLIKWACQNKIKRMGLFSILNFRDENLDKLTKAELQEVIKGLARAYEDFLR